MEHYFGALGKDPIEALAKVTPLVDAIMKAQDEGDYDAFVANFEDAMKEAVSKSDFEANSAQIKSTMGALKEHNFVCTLKRQGMLALVYKCIFDGSEDDFLITITVNDQTQPVKAAGIWIS